MRSAPLSSLILTCLLAGPLTAQAVPYAAVVAQNNTEVRCKPGNTDAIYPTNRLQAGDRVQVVEERADGWAGIVPPEGSFSYINTRNLQANYWNWMVVADPQVKVPVYVGSSLIDKRPTVVGANLERGAQVRSHWQMLQDSEGTWLPIEPPAGEVRYVRLDALRKPTPVAPLGAAPPAQPPVVQARAPEVVQAIPESQPSSFVPAPPPAAPLAVAAAPAPAATNTLWTRAYQAERAGRIPEAVEIYTQFYRENVATNPRDANWALERAAFLQSGGRKTSAAVSVTPPVNNYATYPPQTKLVPLQNQVDPPPVLPTSRGGFANPPAAEKPSVQLASRIESPDDSKPSAKLNPPSLEAGPAATNPSSTSAGGNQQVYSSGPGTLMRAGVRLDGQPTYRLLTAPGNPTLYVTAVPGIDLERFVDKKVELIGAAEYRGELRANHLLVRQVQPLADNP